MTLDAATSLKTVSYRGTTTTGAADTVDEAMSPTEQSALRVFFQPTVATC